MKMFKGKSAKFKQLAKLSFIPSIFNITEPIMFGMPIILNPMFFIPQCFTQIICGFVTWGLVATVLPINCKILQWHYYLGQHQSLLKCLYQEVLNYTILMVICFAITFLMWYPF